jgi:hypothetical protein
MAMMAHFMATLILLLNTVHALAGQGAGHCALSFDGVNDYVRVPHSASLSISGPITILVWVYLTRLNVDQKILHKQSPGYKLCIYTNNKVEFEIRDPTEQYHLNRDVPGGTVLELNRWYFVGGSWNGTEIRSIVNGAFERPFSYTGAMGTTTNDLGIGVEYNWTSRFFNGLIDEVRIYEEALTTSQIQQLYAQGLKQLLAKGLISQEEYNQRMAELKTNH